MADTRARLWAGVCYPDSVPDNWLAILEQVFCKVLVSPLHDRDVNADGEPKKPHWHVLFVFDGKKSFEQVSKIMTSVNGTVPIVVQSARSYARYLCHLDNPDKVVYRPADVIELGGVDYRALIDSEADVQAMLSVIEAYIDSSGLTSYAALCRYAREFEPDWTRVIRCHTYHLKAYLQSFYWEGNINNQG